jgi:subtilase family serine protease
MGVRLEEPDARQHPGRLSRSRRAHLLAVAVLVSGVSVAGCTGGSSSPAKTTPAGSALSAAVSGCLRPPAYCYAPRLFQAAYGIQPLLDSGIDGRGETVTVLTAPSSISAAGLPPGQLPDVTDIRHDLAAFDRMFQLPAARIQVVTTLAGSASPWQATGEEALDLEMVHTVAPAATLRVVRLPSGALGSVADMLAGLRLATSGTDVASIGWSLGERFFTKAQLAQLHSALRGAAAQHVTVVANSGDTGAFSQSFAGTPVKGVGLPAANPLVLAVGGTTLTANPLTGAYIRETAWNPNIGSYTDSLAASGGGFSHLYARPAYQDGVPGISANRGVPDVAGDAGQQGGIPVVFAAGGRTWIVSATGTSAAVSLWAGLMALADQYAHHSLGFVNPAIYRIARSSKYHKAFHDVTTGNNKLAVGGTIGYFGYQAAPGWDPVTGWGTPNAQVLVPLLARVAGESG